MASARRSTFLITLFTAAALVCAWTLFAGQPAHAEGGCPVAPAGAVVRSVDDLTVIGHLNAATPAMDCDDDYILVSFDGDVGVVARSGGGTRSVTAPNCTEDSPSLGCAIVRKVSKLGDWRVNFGGRRKKK